MKKIVIDIDETGAVRIETEGFVGRSCIEETRFLKDLLGKETAQQLTPAYFATARGCVKKHLPLCG